MKSGRVLYAGISVAAAFVACSGGETDRGGPGPSACALADNGTSADRVKSATILDKLNNAGHSEPLWFDPNCNGPPEACE
jgi:hypothetical protein